ncbi:hypothetical protein EDC96DRAFT_549870 [Choanephora cucurbitarum]|nr:hypothetical protein EDC96DRAFT_549870 [Choanephora cucurbitarum]
MLNYQFSRILFVEAFPLKDDNYFYYRQDRLFQQLKRILFPQLLINEETAEVLNEDYEVNFYHFLDDEPCGSVRCFVDPEEARMARDKFWKQMKLLQPSMVVISSGRLARTIFQLNSNFTGE